MFEGEASAAFSGFRREPSGASEEAISFHYDAGNDFYRLWLDERMIYSAARWADPIDGSLSAVTLEDAQVQKLEHHLRAARVVPGDRILDVGCGWGALMRYAVEHFGAASATGLTLSRNQFDHVADAAVTGVKVLLRSYEDYDPGTMFNAIFSIGSLEHFVKPGLCSEERVAIYRGFFERMRSWLVPGGRLCLQAICWAAADPVEARKIVPESVFPESDLPFFDEVVRASVQGFDLVHMESSRLDYIRTLEEWLLRLRCNRERLHSAPGGSDQFQFYEDYLRQSIVGFRRRKTTLGRFVLERA
jgi:cyclopropane-fatty-acyl-phospholipid synthase